ncbi:MAG: bifunctional hydroxymethylpyrimidine kinase/phosphomethylpyrimidine kinase [Elusimicrobia bacterium]|nr:bifunctional hydroxymethylpyrimidine kinase/phosphomethylpyrimidine kinase [Elusimicrobiota bacterium]
MARLIPRVLTIADSDSSGGAGLQADLKTFTALKVYGMSVVTSVTAQNTQGVSAVFDLPADMAARQLAAVVEDIGVDAAKTGMLSNAGIIETMAAEIRRFRVRKLVVDPVMRAKGGDPLLRSDAQGALVRRILPLALVVTPNIPEAEVLAGRRVSNFAQRKEAAKRIADLGPRFVLVKGGHASEPACRDLLFDGRGFHILESPRIRTKNTHGTGCTLSAALAAYLALGFGVPEAAQKAKEYVTGAIRRSFSLGRGHGPLNHFWSLP